MRIKIFTGRDAPREMPISEGAKVRDVIAPFYDVQDGQVYQHVEEGSDTLPRKMNVAVNGEAAKPDTVLSDGQFLTILPTGTKGG